MANLKQVAWRDWSLVFFTVLTQASAGIILCLVLLGGIAGAALSYRTGPVLSNPVLLALLLTGAATLVSLLHLGNPRNAPRALGNLKGSWLSREILAIGVYSACLLLAFARDWSTGMDNHTFDLLAIGALAGIALIWMMIKVYTIATVPAWNTWYTPFSFVATMLGLGPLILLTMQSGGLIYFPYGASDALLYVVLAVLVTGALAAYLHLSRLQKMDSGIERIEFGKGAYFRLHQLRMVLLAVALLVVIAQLMQVGIDASSNGAWSGFLLALVLTAEIVGRLLFYASYFRAGV